MKKLIFCAAMVVYSLLHAEPTPCLEVGMDEVAKELVVVPDIEPSSLGKIHPDEAQFKERLKLCLAHHAVCMMLAGRDYLVWVEQDTIEPIAKDLNGAGRDVLFIIMQINDPRLKRQSCMVFYNTFTHAMPWEVFHWQVERGRMKYQLFSSVYFTLGMRAEDIFSVLAKEYEFMQEKIDKEDWEQ